MSFVFDSVDLNVISPENKYSVDSKLKDRSPLYSSTVKAHYCATMGQEVVLPNSLYTMCSFYNGPISSR